MGSELNINHKGKAKKENLGLLVEIHDCSGLSLREVAQTCDLDATSVHYTVTSLQNRLIG